MEKIALIFIFCSILVKAYSQDNLYHEAIDKGDTEFRKGEYKNAINFYFAAAAYRPAEKSNVKEKVNKVFDAIIALQKKAEGALAEAKKQKDIAQKALDQINKFQEKSIGKSYQGGIIFYSDSAREHGLIAAEKDLDSSYNWEDAKDTCGNLILNGYDDWFLPSKDTLALLYFFKSYVGSFAGKYYWSSTQDQHTTAWSQGILNAYQRSIKKDTLQRVRPVRAF